MRLCSGRIFHYCHLRHCRSGSARWSIAFRPDVAHRHQDIVFILAGRHSHIPSGGCRSSTYNPLTICGMRLDEKFSVTLGGGRPASAVPRAGFIGPLQ